LKEKRNAYEEVVKRVAMENIALSDRVLSLERSVKELSGVMDSLSQRMNISEQKLSDFISEINRKQEEIEGKISRVEHDLADQKIIADRSSALQMEKISRTNKELYSLRFFVDELAKNVERLERSRLSLRRTEMKPFLDSKRVNFDNLRETEIKKEPLRKEI
jgi:predicted nuclease with TOPRIM domain